MRKREREDIFFLGYDLTVRSEKAWSVAVRVQEKPNDVYENYSLDKEILAKCNSDEELQEEFNKNVIEVIKTKIP